MLKVEELLDPVALEALIRGVREHALYRKLYALLDRSLLKVKQVIENQYGCKRLVCYDTSLLILIRKTSIK
jgi:hypothetical protein